MQTNNRIHKAIGVLALTAGSTVGLGQGVLVIDGQGSSASNGESPYNLPGSINLNGWISDETIAENLNIYANREEIAQLAVWIGPGPTNIQPIMAGGDEWLDDFRAEAAEWFATEGRVIPGLTVKSRKSSRRRGSRSIDVGPPTPFGEGPDNTAHSVSQLWPTAQVNGRFVAQIPYSFDDEMIDAWNARGGTDDPTELNAIAGIASALSTMLIIEQLAPVQFIGFNPQTDPANGFLQFSNGGDADFDVTTPRVSNVASQLGRPNTADEDAEPTTLTHESWSNFPSIVRSIGFALGLDWEQRQPDRDMFIITQPQNIPPQTFPLPVASLDGNDGAGVTALTSPDPDLDNPITAGPLLFGDNTLLTTAENTPGCDFDFDAIMLLRPFDLGGSATYIIRDEFRYSDFNDDGEIDPTPFGPDDRMSSQPPAVFFSDCELAALDQMYSVEFRWYYGLNPDCPHDVNNDGIQGSDDLQAFVELWEARDPAADLVPPLGFIDLLDLQAFSLGDEDNNIDLFTPGFCNEFGPPGPGFRPGGNLFPPEG